MRYQSGARAEYTYYKNNLFKTLTNKKSDGTVMDTYTYTYDDANNQTSKHEVINEVEKGTTSYEYDSLNRLKKVTEPNGRVTEYTFDAAGNREAEKITLKETTTLNTYVYNEQNRLMSVTTRVNNVISEVRNFTYDSNGNEQTKRSSRR